MKVYKEDRYKDSYYEFKWILDRDIYYLGQDVTFKKGEHFCLINMSNNGNTRYIARFKNETVNKNNISIQDFFIYNDIDLCELATSSYYKKDKVI